MGVKEPQVEPTVATQDYTTTECGRAPCDVDPVDRSNVGGENPSYQLWAYKSSRWKPRRLSSLEVDHFLPVSRIDRNG